MALVPADNIARIRGTVKRFSSGFTSGQKVGVIACLVAIVAALFLFMNVSSKPTYTILFSNLKAQDAASITTLLTTNHVPYQLQDGGSTILVPQNDVNQERLASASAGLPSQGTVGLSILDKEGLTTSQLTQQADYLQGLQGELEQTIDAIQGVTGSQVNIAMPANQQFALGTNNPTGASVLVDLASGQSLSYTEVSSITNLVASSVPGLTSDEVTVADSNGNLLAGPGVNDTGAIQNGAEQNYDATLVSQLQTYLTSVLGTGNSDVSVNALLNFNKVNTQTQTIVTGANGQATSFCTSTNTSSTKYNGTGAPAGVTVTTVAGTGNYTQTSNTKTCETGTQTQTVQQAPGSVTKLDVAVLVNSKALPRGLTMGRLQSEVAAAAGIQPGRGDVLSFSSAVFKQATSATPTPKPSILTKAMKPGIAALLAIVFLVLLLLSSRKAKRRALEVATDLPSLPSDWTASHLLPGELPTSELPAVSLTVAQLENENAIAELVSRSPAEIASVLREMMAAEQ